MLVAPEKSLLQPCSPFWLEGTLAGTDISPKQQGALGLYLTVYPTEAHIHTQKYSNRAYFDSRLDLDFI